MRNSSIIVLIDMDCFYVQVELQSKPEFKGKPCAVVQYNTWLGGSIIAVSYEARYRGVTRNMRGDEAKEKCNDLHIFSVPEMRGKADLTRYRNAGADVIKCLSRHASMLERASIDEAYIDLTDEVDNLLIAAPDDEEIQRFWLREQQYVDGCHSVGFESYAAWLDYVWQMRDSEPYCDDIRLALASYLVFKMREDVYTTLGYRCSAGIAHSKVIAKYACGINKPNQQTVVSSNHVATLFQDASIYKIRNLGGKLGKIVHERLNVDTMGQLTHFTLAHLIQCFGERTGSWLHGLCRGIDDEGVISRQLTQSIGCSKRFPGDSKLDTLDMVRHWVTQMAHEIVERVDQDRSTNGRIPSHLCVNYRQLRSDLGEGGKKSISGSRVVPVRKLTVQDITSAAIVILSGLNNAGHKNMPENSWYPPLISLGLSAGKFRPQVAKDDISRFLIDAPAHSTSNARPKIESVDQSGDCSTHPDLEGLSVTGDSTHEEESSTVTTIEVDTHSDISEGPPAKKGFFARRLEREQARERDQEEAVPASASDYVKCDQCNQQIIVWEAPEHFDWHVARQVQRDLNREVMDEDARRRQAEKATANTTISKGRAASAKEKTKGKGRDAKPNQPTIDRFLAH